MNPLTSHDAIPLFSSVAGASRMPLPSLKLRSLVQGTASPFSAMHRPSSSSPEEGGASWASRAGNDKPLLSNTPPTVLVVGDLPRHEKDGGEAFLPGRWSTAMIEAAGTDNGHPLAGGFQPRKGRTVVVRATSTPSTPI